MHIKLHKNQTLVRMATNNNKSIIIQLTRAKNGNLMYGHGLL